MIDEKIEIDDRFEVSVQRVSAAYENGHFVDSVVAERVDVVTAFD